MGCATRRWTLEVSHWCGTLVQSSKPPAAVYFLCCCYSAVYFSVSAVYSLLFFSHFPQLIFLQFALLSLSQLAVVHLL